ncbi:MAG: hypothetical protein WCJ28_07615, partial [Actinomycetota bacterium]
MLQSEFTEKQLRHEISRLDVDSLIDVSPGAIVRPDVLRDLVKLRAPAVKKRCDRLKEAMKAYLRDHGANRGLALEAQQAYEKADDWVCAVDDRYHSEELHNEIKQLDKIVDFEPFKPGGSVSVFEFFTKFEDWSRGSLSLSGKAHLLYHKYLDPSIVRGSKQLEARKENYTAMKTWLTGKYGSPKLVAGTYLRSIKKLVAPSDPQDVVGRHAHLKEIHRNLVTMMDLEEEPGVKVARLEDYIY